MKKSTVFRRVIGCLAVLFAGVESVMAHPGHDSSGFASGALHPWFGADHLLAMLAVGLWAYQMGGRAIWMVPLSFVSVMFAGGFLGIGREAFGGMEQIILASVFVMGLLVVSAVRLPVWTAALVAGGFAFFHSYAHGTEMPAGSSALVFSAGFVLSTICLHLLGIGAGAVIGRQVWLRAAGGAIAGTAAMLCFS